MTEGEAALRALARDAEARSERDRRVTTMVPPQPLPRTQQRLWIPGPMPSLNQLIGGKVKDRIRLKRQWRDVVTACANRQIQRQARFESVVMRYDFQEKRGGQGRDPLNILAGAAKIIEDALVKMGVLKGDHQGVIKGIVLGPIVHCPACPGVTVTIEDATT